MGTLEFQEVLALARHEVGHYVVNRCLGFSPGDIKIEIKGPSQHYADTTIWLPLHDGYCDVDVNEPLASAADVKGWLDRRIQALLAGALAQSLEGDQPNCMLAGDILFKANGADDHKFIRAFVNLIWNIESTEMRSTDERKDEMQSIFARNWDKAFKLVHAEAAVIHEFAEIVASHARCHSEPMKKKTIEQLGVIKRRFGPTDLS